MSVQPTDIAQLFKPIASNRLSDETVQQVQELIATGDLQPGDKLPSERQLVKQLGVSRTSLREALRMLETMGLVEVRPGLGTFITESGLGKGLQSRWVAWLVENEQAVSHLLEVREALEPKAVALAAERITDEALVEIEDNLVIMENCARHHDIDGAVETDIKYHDLISRASGNDFLIELNDSINHELVESRYAYYQEKKNILTSLEHHTEIFNAIKAQDVPLATSLMLQHVQYSRQRIRAIAETHESEHKGGNHSEQDTS